tara:strand:- start:11 stop:424 length:414 start_codon:yes stop_codon:yes gene_type:complete
MDNIANYRRQSLLHSLLSPLDFGGGAVQGAPNWHAAPASVEETEGAYILTVEIPGISKEDVALSIDNNILRVKGVKKAPESGNRLIVNERKVGEFERTFTLSEEIDQKNISAEFSNGILCISAPKTAKVTPRKIDIR